MEYAPCGNSVHGKLEASAANAAGALFWDLAYSQYFSTEEGPKITEGVYNSYFSPPHDPNLDTVSFNLRDYLDIAAPTLLVAVTI